jgi:hypothetical protein
MTGEASKIQVTPADHAAAKAYVETSHLLGADFTKDGGEEAFLAGKISERERIMNPNNRWNCLDHGKHVESCEYCRKITREMECQFCRIWVDISRDKEIEIGMLRQEIRDLKQALGEF